MDDYKVMGCDLFLLSLFYIGDSLGHRGGGGGGRGACVIWDPGVTLTGDT